MSDNAWQYLVTISCAVASRDSYATADMFYYYEKVKSPSHLQVCRPLAIRIISKELADCSMILISAIDIEF